MKKSLLVVAGSLLIGSLVACGGSGTDDKKPEPVEPTALTTIKATYEANYSLDISPKDPETDKFAEKVDSKVDFNIDYTAGNVYFYAKRTNSFVQEDGTSVDAVYEALINKTDAGYQFLTSTMSEPLAIASEEIAVNKINYFIKKTTNSKAGYLDADAFTMTDQKAYNHKYAVQESKDYVADSIPEATLTTTETGTKGEVKLKYIGYVGDQGLFAVGHEGEHAATVTYTLDKNAHVTSWDLDYNNPFWEISFLPTKPTTTVIGGRNFTATYGEELTKLTTLENHADKMVKVNYKENVKGGSLEVFSSKPDDFENKTPYVSGTDVLVDTWIIVKPTLNEGTVGIQSLNLNKLPAMEIRDGYYIFEAVDTVDGINELEVVFKIASKGDAKITIDAATAGKYFNGKEIKYHSYELPKGSPEPVDLKAVLNTNIIKVYGDTVGGITITKAALKDEYKDAQVKDFEIEVTFTDKDGNDSVIDASETKRQNFGNFFYSVHLREAGTYKFSFTYNPQTPVTGKATIKTAATYAGFPTVEILDAAAGTMGEEGLASATKITLGTDYKMEVGRQLVVKLPAECNKTNTKVTVGDLALIGNNAFGGTFNFSVAEAKEYTVTIEKIEVETTKINVNYLSAYPGCTVQVYAIENGKWDTLGNPRFLIKQGAEVDSTKVVCVKVNGVEGVEGVTVTSGVINAMFVNGYYAFNNIPEGTKTLDITVTVPGADTENVHVTINKDAHVKSVESVLLDITSKETAPEALPENGIAPKSEKQIVAMNIVPEEGYVIYSVKYNGINTAFMKGSYGFPIKNAGEYVVEIKTVAVDSASVKFTENADVKATMVFTFKLGQTGNPEQMQMHSTGKFTPAEGLFVGLKINCVDGKQAKTVTVNGMPTQFIGGFYCFFGTTAGEFTATVETEVRTTAKIAVTVAEGATYTAQEMLIPEPGKMPTDIKDLTFNGGNAIVEVAPTKHVLLKVTAPAGKVAVVKVDGVVVESTFGGYDIAVAVAKDYRVEITLTDAPAQ